MGRKSKGVEIVGQVGELPAEAAVANATPEISGVGEALEVVVLLKPHTHGGVDYAVGEKLTVRPPIADWLRQRGVITKDPA